MDDSSLSDTFKTAPCGSYSTLSESYRSPSVSGNSGLHCDSALAVGWYRFILNGWSAKMLTSAPAEWSCGTHAPVWWNGMLLLLFLFFFIVC